MFKSRFIVNTCLQFTLFAGVSVIGSSCSLVFGIEDECTQNSDCISLGENFVCTHKLCVLSDDGIDTDTDSLTGMDLLGGPCTRLDGMDDPTQTVPDDAIVIGSILPITGELSLAGEYFDHVTQLAIEELNRAGGLFGRKFIKISCDSGSDSVQAVTAAEHLRDLGVQAVLGPFSSEIVMSVYNNVFREAAMMLVSAGANAPILSSVSSEGLIWSTSLPASREATATAEYLRHSTWSRVAVIYRGDTWGDSMFNAFYTAYCTADGIDCENDDTFLVRSYDTGDLASSISSVVADLSVWQPDVTVAFSYIEDSLTFLTIVGKTGAPLRSLLWNSSIASDVMYDSLEEKYQDVLCKLQATTQQMPGGLVYGSFLTRYRARWDGEDPIPYTANFYDAVYMLAYAYAAASGDDHPNPTGIEIAAAMERLSSGAEINAGAEDWNSGIMTLRADSSSTIDYVGAAGDVDFPEGTGSIICPVEEIRFNVGNKSIESIGLIYAADDTYSAPDYSEIVDTVCGADIQP